MVIYFFVKDVYKRQKENTKLKTNTAINNISGSSKVIKKAIKQADRAAYSLGYTDKAYDILFDKEMCIRDRFCYI